MSERPILFSGPMVRAILAGKKTQTRRVVKIGHIGTAVEFVGGRGQENDPACWGYADEYGDYHTLVNEEPRLRVPCPYGQPGDKLWVRETIKRGPMPNFLTGEPTDAIVALYSAGEDPRHGDDFVTDPAGFNMAPWWSGKVLPSIHMPRWASRLTLDVTGVRVERLQAITEEDARAEGLKLLPPVITTVPDAGRRAFARLWDEINGKRAPWASNPWVWVISFAPPAAEQGKAGRG